MLDVARERKWREEDVDGMFGEEEAAQLEAILGNVEGINARFSTKWRFGRMETGGRGRQRGGIQGGMTWE
jgi:hypothetical protein